MIILFYFNDVIFMTSRTNPTENTTIRVLWTLGRTERPLGAIPSGNRINTYARQRHTTQLLSFVTQ